MGGKEAGWGDNLLVRQRFQLPAPGSPMVRRFPSISRLRWGFIGFLANRAHLRLSIEVVCPVYGCRGETRPEVNGPSRAEKGRN